MSSLIERKLHHFGKWFPETHEVAFRVWTHEDEGVVRVSDYERQEKKKRKRKGQLRPKFQSKEKRIVSNFKDTRSRK